MKQSSANFATVFAFALLLASSFFTIPTEIFYQTQNFTLPALQKNFVNIFSCLPGNFALQNGGDFW